MKKLTTIIIAIALILGMSQCKKNVETITPSNLGEAVHITVNVDDGGKHIVYPGTGAYVFENGDKLYVGNNGRYRGTLTYNSGAFSGDIYSPSTEDYLHFYFVGGLTPSATPEAGTTTDFTVNIANQSSKLPVLSYAHSTQKYVDGTTTYGCTLLNKCGLVKFNLSTATDKAVTVSGLYTTATINFASAQEGITPEGTTGAVTLRNEGTNSERWAILLPQAAINHPTVTIAGFSSSIATLPQTSDNTYNNTGVNITNSASGSLPGVFTVASGKTVNFSQGNLQYIGSASTPYWKFAENQYDYIGTGQNGDATNVDRDLFGWGTTGYRDTRTSSTGYQTNYYPYSTSNTMVGSSANKYGYGPDFDLSNRYGLTVANKSDWGMHAITNGGNTAGMWRTLTSSEWAYLFNVRSNTTVNNVENARFTKAAITTPSSTTVNGLIIFPDSYSGGTPSGVTWGTINGTSNDYTTTCTVDGWAALEAAGCVFLPAAGNRGGTSVYTESSVGYYWSSSTYSNSSEGACGTFFSSGSFNPSSGLGRYNGFSVRLVCQVEQ